jgi:adenylate cyclase
VKPNPITRRLVAIVVADVVGYTRLMEHDEGGTHARLHEIRDQVVDPEIAALGGRIVKTAGDGMLVEFGSAAAALRFAIEVQRAMSARNQPLAPDERIQFRIGINLGDIIVDGNDIAGDGVNVAARLETLSEPGGICVSAAVRDQIHEDLSVEFTDIGEQHVKNIARPIRVYRVEPRTGAYQQPSRRRWQRLTRVPGWRWLAAGVLALGIVGIAVFALPQFWKTAPAPMPPAMSVAIAPVTAPHGDADASRFAEALTHDLTTGLSRVGGGGGFPRVRVVPGGAASAGRNGAIDARELGRRLNVRYVLEGDILRVGDGNTVNLRLVDVATGGQVWSQRDTLQDSDAAAESSTKLRKLMRRVSGAVGRNEILRVRTLPQSSLTPTELVLRANALWDSDAPSSLAGLLEARKLVKEALSRDPNLVAALVTDAQFIYYGELIINPNADRGALKRELDEVTRRAVTLEPDPSAWDWRMAALESLGQWDAALQANDMSIRLDPHEPEWKITRAALMSDTGRPAEALPLIDGALATDSVDIARAMRIACLAHLLLGQAEQAIGDCEKASALTDSWDVALLLAAAYANHGDMAKAAAARARALRVSPGFTIARARVLDEPPHPEYLKLAEKYWYEGLRKAGFPEQ